MDFLCPSPNVRHILLLRFIILPIPFLLLFYEGLEGFTTRLPLLKAVLSSLGRWAGSPVGDGDPRAVEESSPGERGPVPQISCATLAMVCKPLFPALPLSLCKQVTDVPFLILAVAFSFLVCWEACGGWVGCWEQAETHGNRVLNCSWVP